MKRPIKSIPAGYGVFLDGVIGLLEDSRRAAGRAVNSILSVTYWEIGRRIFEHEQKGKSRANYGELLLDLLSHDLSRRFGRGFSRTNVFQMRQFYLAYRDKIQTTSGQSGTRSIVQTLSGQFDGGPFPLSWSHYVRLLSVTNPDARGFYEQEAIRGGWSVRQLDRQISTLFYDRSLRSRKAPTASSKPEDRTTPEEEIRDPFVLEFLGLRDEYSESDLEEALVHHLGHFLLELGNDFAFVARQKRLRISHEWLCVAKTPPTANSTAFAHTATPAPAALRRVTTVDPWLDSSSPCLPLSACTSGAAPTRRSNSSPFVSNWRSSNGGDPGRR